MRSERMTAAICLMSLALTIYIHHETNRTREQTLQEHARYREEIKHLYDSIDQLNSELIAKDPGFGWQQLIPLDTVSVKPERYQFHIQPGQASGEYWYMKEDSSCYHVDKNGVKRQIPLDSFKLIWRRQIMKQNSVLI